MTYIVENNGVYGLTKGQFSATADRGSKSKRGVTNTDNAIDLVGDRAAARRELRGAQLLRRQDPARAADRGGDPAPGRGLHRRDQPLRRLQQSRRLDQELRLRARAQRGGEPARRHHRRAIRSRSITRRARCRWSSSTTARGSRCASSTPTTTCTIGWRRWRSCRSTPPRARWSPDCSTSIPTPRTCTPTSTRWTTPLNALEAKDLCPGTAALEKINASLR